MARSKEAIRRRAQKRNRTVEEQQKIDWQTHQKQLEQREEHEKGRNTTNNHDGASSLSCCDANKTTNPVTSSPEHRNSDLVGDKSESLSDGAGTAASSSRQGSPDSLRRRQSNTTTPTTTNPSWGKQADANTIEGNRRLRQEYLKTGGIGMSLADQERARILIARDERKQEKKQRYKTAVTPLKPQGSVSTMDRTESKSTEKNHDKKSALPNEISATESKKARKRNKALRKRYRETNGEGMTKEEQERAKILITRDERKKQKRQAITNGNDDKSRDGKLIAVSSDAKNEKNLSKSDDKKARKALRKRYKKTKGEGMTAEEQERAKILIECHRSKRQKRTAKRDEMSRKRHKKDADTNIQHSVQ